MNPLIIKKLNINKPEKAKAKILFYISRNHPFNPSHFQIHNFRLKLIFPYSQDVINSSWKNNILLSNY